MHIFRPESGFHGKGRCDEGYSSCPVCLQLTTLHSIMKVDGCVLVKLNRGVFDLYGFAIGVLQVLTSHWHHNNSCICGLPGLSTL